MGLQLTLRMGYVTDVMLLKRLGPSFVITVESYLMMKLAIRILICLNIAHSVDNLKHQTQSIVSIVGLNSRHRKTDFTVCSNFSEN